MKKSKDAPLFSFDGYKNEEMVNYLNTHLPISIKYNEDLVNRVHAKYPLLDKSEVAIIIKAIFSSWRDLLILGKTLNFNNLFFDTKLLFFTYRWGGVIFPAVKIHLSTPPRLRKNEK